MSTATATQTKQREQLFYLFVITIMVINAGLTYFFGATYLGTTFDTGNAALSKFLGGIMLTVFFDLATFAWYLAKQGENQTNTQRAVATTLGWASMMASVLASVIQLVTTTTLIDLTAVKPAFGIGGLVISTLMAAAHFIGYYIYNSNSPAEMDIDATSERNAMMQSFRLQQVRRVDEKVMSRAQQELDKQIDNLAQAEADRVMRNFFTQFHATKPELSNPTPLQEKKEEPVVFDLTEDDTEMIAEEAVTSSNGKSGNGHGLNGHH